MRAFWGIELPSPVREHLVEAQEALGKRLPAKLPRWTQPDKMHMTLKYLGEVSNPGPLVAAVEGLPSLDDPLQLELDHLGSFGGRRPSVVWAGLGGPGLEALCVLHEAVESAHAPLGFAPEGRPFRPHVTLARFKHGRGRRVAPRALKEALKGVALAPCPFTIRELVLFESSYGDGGPVHYTPRSRWAFSSQR